MSHITLASEGTATYFGELSIAAGQRNNGASTQVRGVFGGGMGTPAQLNAMDYITIASAGDAIDFGDLSKEIESINWMFRLSRWFRRFLRWLT